MYDWLCVIANPITKTETVIVNNPDELRAYYKKFKDEIFIGYNIREYDSYIFKGILAGFNPYDINEHIITKGLKGYQFSNVLREYPLITYDLLQLNTSLKQLEAMQGHNVYESEVDFRLKRKLTPAEIKETVSYCKNDVQETINLFTQLKGDFDVQLELINEFKLPIAYMGKTQSQLVAEIMQAQRVEYEDEFNLNFPPYLDKIKKYKHIVDWFRQFKTDKKFTDEEKKELYSQSLNVEVAGVPHTFAWGGLHGALLKYYGEGWYLHIDVSQYYPSLTVGHNYFSRATSEEGKKRYDMMRRESIRLKKFPELKTKRNGYKLCNNKAYGCMKDKYNALYDPLMANNICVTGQLALLLLIEMLEGVCKLIQSNTDGLIVKLNSLDDYELIDDICYEWEQMTGVKLAFDPIITRIYQKDVNNYLFINEEGDTESKGAYVKGLSALDNDLPIVNKALKEYMINGTPVETTVNGAEELVEFQKIVKLSGKYDYVYHNGKQYRNKCYRVFASKSDKDGIIYKVKLRTKEVEAGLVVPDTPKMDKFANTPECCFMENGDIRGKGVSTNLDRQYYIDLAYERLRQFGGV
jgi:DNA polymerase